MAQKLILLAVVAVMALAANAYDFRVDGLCYNKNADGLSVTVTYQNLSSPRYAYLSGDLQIPDSVTYNGSDYLVTSIYQNAFMGCSGLTSVTIPNSVTSIGGAAFAGCSGLTNVTIGNSVSLIDEQAFADCSGLTSVTIPNSVTTIGNKAFYKCWGLTSLTIPSSVLSIGTEAFFGCIGLTSVKISNSVLSIGSKAFASCRGLDTIVVENGNKTYDSRDNCNAIIETSSNTLITGCQNTIIPKSVTSIGSEAFSGCRGLTSVSISKSVSSIGEKAFSGCSGLTSIVVENENKTYDSRDNCNAIIETSSNTLITGCQNTIIPNSVTSIGNGAFYGCNSLKSVTISNSVSSIGSGAFSGCTGLTSVTWNAKSCSNFLYYFNAPFYNLTNIQTFKFGHDVEHIPTYLCYGLSLLKNVDIPNSVTSIGTSAFLGCTRLTNVTIGNSITLIGSNAFYRCSELASVTSRIADPTKVSCYESFNDVPMKCTLYVPRGRVDIYKNTEPWNKFRYVKEETGIKGDVNGDNLADVSDVNIVIDMVLGKQAVTPEADLNGDGNIDVSDVNALIDIVLGK